MAAPPLSNSIYIMLWTDYIVFEWQNSPLGWIRDIYPASLLRKCGVVHVYFLTVPSSCREDYCPGPFAIAESLAHDSSVK